MFQDAVHHELDDLNLEGKSPLRGVHDLIVEDREVQRKTQADRVGGRKVVVCSLGRHLREILRNGMGR